MKGDSNEPQQIGVPEDWESDASSRKQDPSSENGGLLPPSQRARKEKYANYRHVDGGEWPQNWVLGAKLEQRFEEYPKQRRLLDLKRAAVAATAHAPMHLSSSDLTALVESQCKFDVILLDPPVSETTDSSKDFTWNDVQAMPIPALAAEPSFIFMWVGSGAGDGLERGREVLARWGFRRCEDVVWVKTNKNENRGPGGDAPTTSLFTRTKQHCLMGIKGTVRRSTDSWFVHCNIDTDVIVWDGDPTVPGRPDGGMGQMGPGPMGMGMPMNVNMGMGMGGGPGMGMFGGMPNMMGGGPQNGMMPNPGMMGNNMFGGMPVGMPGPGMMFNQNFAPGGFDGGMGGMGGGGNMPFDQMGGGGPGWDGSQRGPFQGANPDGMMQQQMFMNNMMGNQMPPRFNGNMGGF
ncbi:hypothetical protein RSAG8_05348, partial [Rhizoctonia solani AG-8 WAC10335]